MTTGDGVLFNGEVWRPAVEKFGAATHLTVSVFSVDERVVYGPVYPTPLFELFAQYGYEPGMAAECARRCLVQADTRPAVVLASAFGLAAVGTSLVLDGRTVGAAVARYSLLDFCQRSEMELLARAAGVPFKELWEVARLLQPVPERRLLLHGELLQVLGDSLLREIDRTRQNESVMRRLNEELEHRVADRTVDLTTANDTLRQEISQRERAETETRRLLRQLEMAQEEERRRIARDLHDQLGQELTALRLSVAVCKERIRDEAALRKHLAQAESIATRLDGEVEFLTWQLRPLPLNAGIVTAIENHASEWSKHFGVAVDFHTSGFGDGRILPLVEINLYRIAQEALNNVAKHAAATRVALILEQRDECALLVVEDDGRGFDVDRTVTDGNHQPLGLMGMRERAALVAGTVEIESEPCKGTTVIVRIPLRESRS